MYAEQKAALLLTTLNPRDAEAILTRLGPEQGNRLRVQIQELAQSPDAQEQLNEVLQEFDSFLQQVEVGLTPPPAAPPSEPSQPASTDRAQESTGAPSNSDQDDVIAQLRSFSADDLSLALQSEQPRTAALILETFDAVQAGEVLKRLPPAMRDQVSLQLGRTVPVDPEVLQCIARAVIHKQQHAEEVPPPPTEQARYRKMADMLRLLSKPDRLAVLTALEHDSAVAAGVKEFLYQFEDLLRIEDRSMQKLLAEVDSKSLATALKEAPNDIRDKIMNNLSKRARETLVEEMEFLGAVPAAQIEQARKAVVEVVQRMDQAGELVMAD
ncbi:MAG TPA: FliG C-terminal domain-containing protein [Gemmataceae bacterium]|nr:FliG C-terminal domain-containing protein [Gemmataceae bacterium]